MELGFSLGAEQSPMAIDTLSMISDDRSTIFVTSLQTINNSQRECAEGYCIRSQMILQGGNARMG